MDTQELKNIAEYRVVMHSQESYDHPIAYNESAWIPTTQKFR